jgi:phage repressor protein C with HTH and peptisase S24 domain
MLSHKQIWGAIDALASRYGHSPSGLARAAGLDPTTFNKSKRLGPNGRLRWPSTESISKILQVTGASFEEFVAFVSRGSNARHPSRMLPVLKMKDVVKKKAFDSDGRPIRKAWNRLPFPDLADDAAFALEITGGTGMPLLPNGAVVVVSPEAKPKRGDLVVVKDKSGCSLKRFGKRTAKRFELKPLDGAQPDETFERTAVEFVARVVWARH